MAGLSDTMETNVLNYLFKQTALPTPPATLFISLHSADPGDTGASELAATNGYARAQLNPDANSSTNTNWNAVTGSPAEMTNKLAITFPQASGGSWNSGSSIGYWSLWSASSAGTLFCSGTITGGVVVLAGNTLQVTGGTPGTFKFTIE